MKASSQSMGMRSMMADLGVKTKIKVITDATAAKGIAMRNGLGQVSHIETNQLWVQKKVYNKTMAIEKVGGKQNIADALTKPVDQKDLEIHVTGINLEVREGRHGEAPQMAGEESIKRVTWKDENEEGNEYEEKGVKLLYLSKLCTTT